MPPHFSQKTLLNDKNNILGMRIPTSSVYLSDLGSGDPDVRSHDGVYSKYITGNILWSFPGQVQRAKALEHS